MDLVRVYTDGSSSKNGRKDCTSGCGVYFSSSDVKLSINSSEAYKLSGMPIGIQSNNVGELQGILMALIHQTDKSVEMIIHSDSMYCINSISVWNKAWAKNNWITAGGTPVKNKELIQKILDEKSKFKGVYFKHVKGHAKEPDDIYSEEHRDWYGNDTADYLANKAVRG